MKTHTIAHLCKRFSYNDQKAITRFQFALNEAAGVSTRPFIHAQFVRSHRIASSKTTDLIDIMADCVKTAMRKVSSASVHPIEIASDGTMTMQPDEPMVRTVASHLLSNWGANRLGISVTCEHTNPLAFKVCVGPFFELLESVKSAVAKM